jgi:hypothetical protein
MEAAFLIAGIATVAFDPALLNWVNGSARTTAEFEYILVDDRLEFGYCLCFGVDIDAGRCRNKEIHTYGTYPGTRVFCECPS